MYSRALPTGMCWGVKIDQPHIADVLTTQAPTLLCHCEAARAAASVQIDGEHHNCCHGFNVAFCSVALWLASRDCHSLIACACDSPAALSTVVGRVVNARNDTVTAGLPPSEYGDWGY
jgi:hypothetical protein